MKRIDTHLPERIDRDYDSHRAATDSPGFGLPLSGLQRRGQLRDEMFGLLFESTARARGSARSPRARGKLELVPILFPGGIKSTETGPIGERVSCEPGSSTGLAGINHL